MFFRDRRVGQGGRVFEVLKFRTMVPDADRLFGPRQAGEAGPRVTRVGRWLRATAMDELPQLWNIFRGDMSFVGPRALRPGEIHARGDGSLVALRKRAGLPAAPRGAAGADGRRPDLRGPGRAAPAEVPVRPPLHPLAGLLARRAPDRALVLDHLPRALGAPGAEAVSAGLQAQHQPEGSLQVGRAIFRALMGVATDDSTPQP